MTTRWLLCDYGEVLSEPQPDGEVQAMAHLAGVEREVWHDTYWRHRPAYDRGALDAGAYWEVTLGRSVPASELAELVDLDVRSWLHPAPSALAAAERAADAGLGLAVLSNAPHEVADGLDGQEWLARFRPRLFSARLGVTKPDPGIYRAALQALGAAPGDVWFVDDRVANVAAAQEAGLQAALYEGDPAAIDDVISSALARG